MPFGYHFGSSWLHLGSLWATFGVSFRSLFGGAFFHQKRRSKNHPGLQTGVHFGSHFGSIFHHFSSLFWKPQKQVLALPYSTFEGFCSPKALILGSSFGSVFGPFLDPSKRRPAGRSGLNPWPPRGSILVRRGEDLGGGFVDSSRFR